ncbi:MAG: glycosyltransferase [Hydrogenophaga sp.]|nr:glycosyltransferase [Hydrogenophaga sp.]
MESLHANRNDSITSEVYVIDQGNWYSDYKNRLANLSMGYGFNFISLDHNQGIAGGINLAARLNRSPYLCMVTSDTTFTPELDTVLLGELEAHPDIHQITPAVDKGDVPYQVQGYTDDTDPIRCIAQELTIQCWKRQVFQLIGYWDERWIACYESLDYPLRMFLSGWCSAAITHKISCHHEHNTTYHNGSLADAYGGKFDHGPLRQMWDAKWPGLDWSMMYDLGRCTEETRTSLIEQYVNNIELRY